MQQDFKPFEDVMTKISHKNLDSSYEIYFSLYQQLVNNNPGEKEVVKFYRLILFLYVFCVQFCIWKSRNVRIPFLVLNNFFIFSGLVCL